MVLLVNPFWKSWTLTRLVRLVPGLGCVGLRLGLSLRVERADEVRAEWGGGTALTSAAWGGGGGVVGFRAMK